MNNSNKSCSLPGLISEPAKDLCRDSEDRGGECGQDAQNNGTITEQMVKSHKTKYKISVKLATRKGLRDREKTFTI